MRHPERIQEGEDEEAYIRRIAIFPTLSFETLWIWVFDPQSGATGSLLQDWVSDAFPKIDWAIVFFTLPVGIDKKQQNFKSSDPKSSFFTTESDNDIFHPLNRGRIPTKAFAEWIVDENIFDAWRALGEKPTQFAELFIKLVSDKSTDSKQITEKGKRKKPHPDTNRGRLEYFKKEKFIPLVEQVLKENPDWQKHQILSHKKVDDALDKCGFTEGTPSEVTLKNWIKIARDNVGAKAKKGRPAN